MAPRAKALDVARIEVSAAILALDDVVSDELVLQLREVLAAHLADIAAQLLDVLGERLPFSREVERINRLRRFAQR